MRDPQTYLGARIADAMTHLDGDLAINPVPIVRCRNLRFDSAHERDRKDQSPLARASVIENCVKCNVSTNAALVPFWVAFGQYIVQVDLCGSCAEIAIFEHGAVLQVATSGV
ncbi:hypothetical protein I6E74_06225 [Salinibacterium sp. SWN139]|uniref:hypothetical protein n=1 Tax=Salinibacterium sp. SWN139 TaxID=2792055 RepID=UPI0018CE46DE|nr:hypothetical protein [Salinibacterium sp. SWN139]MBH0053767.1 hypothetical protein [Salinibacterium sp. SWN139]